MDNLQQKATMLHPLATLSANRGQLEEAIPFSIQQVTISITSSWGDCNAENLGVLLFIGVVRYPRYWIGLSEWELAAGGTHPTGVIFVGWVWGFIPCAWPTVALQYRSAYRCFSQ
jgi:hypothetical protein